MPNIGVPELIIMLLLIAIPVIVIVAIVVGVQRSGRRRGTTSVVTPPGWLTDPVRRHQFRYWDGTQWTAAVSDDGAESRDPL